LRWRSAVQICSLNVKVPGRFEFRPVSNRHALRLSALWDLTKSDKVMPRYYFDLREDGSFVEDEDGLSLPNINAAQREAAETAAEIGRDRLPKGGVQFVTIDVRDENGDNLLSVTATLEVKRSSQQDNREGQSRSGDAGHGAEPA